MTARIALSLVLASAALAPALSARQQPSAEDLIKAGKAYLATYQPRVSGAVLDERYTLTMVMGGRMDTPSRIDSDLTLVNVNGTLVGLRDAYAISGAKIREAKPRIAPLLAEPTQAKWNQALAYTREALKYFLAETVVRLNDPTLALRFLAPADPAKFTYTVDGRKKINGVETIGLRFQEIRGDDIKYVLATRGNGAVSGRIWIDPSTGAIHQTDLSLDAKTEAGRVTVIYAPAKGLEFLLPSKTVETYEERDNNGSGLGNSANFVKFEANATLTNPRHAPIDVSKARD